MAEPIKYTVPRPRVQTSAREELDRLLETCHQHGVLRFANDVIASNTALARVVVGALQDESVLNALKNALVLLMALSRIPNDQFYRVVFALKDALAELAATTPAQEPVEAPGVAGAYRMLHDEQLWQALTPLVGALKSFAAGLDRQAENPISDFSGKPGKPS